MNVGYQNDFFRIFVCGSRNMDEPQNVTLRASPPEVFDVDEPFECMRLLQTHEIL
jgi:hypothetical protein